jgi:hypothetical protein
MARGRKPIGDKAMTAAERQQRRRDKLKAGLPLLTGQILCVHHDRERVDPGAFKWVFNRRMT